MTDEVDDGVPIRDRIDTEKLAELLKRVADEKDSK